MAADARTGELLAGDVATLSQLVNAKLTELQQTIQLRRAHGLAPALALVETDVGKNTMDSIRVLITRMTTQQELALANANRRAVTLVYWRNLIAAFSTVLNLAVLLWAYRRIRDESARQERAALEVLRQKELLDVTFASIGDALIVTDIAGKITFLNEVAAKLTGWTFAEVRRAAVALSRAVERRAPSLATSKWWKEERQGVFLDYNQNAKDRTTCSAYSVRPLPDARVSTPLHWREVPECDPAEFTIFTVPQRFARIGDPHAEMDSSPGSLEKLLELATKDEAAGLADAPWPPHFRKTEGEAPRVMPSRAKSVAKKPRMKMPLIVVANSPEKSAALAGLERWKNKHIQIAGLLAVDDVLVDSMRGRSSTWTRIRINLRHVPEDLRPPQETPDPDDDPTRQWREMRRKKTDQ